MEKQMKVIDGFKVKNWCCVCEKELKMNVERYQTSGNYCGRCSSKCQIKVKEKSRIKRQEQINRKENENNNTSYDISHTSNGMGIPHSKNIWNKS